MATIKANFKSTTSATPTAQVVNAIEAEAAKLYGEAVKNHLIVTGGAKPATAKPEAKAAPKAAAPRPEQKKPETAADIVLAKETPEEVAQRKAKELQTMLQRFAKLEDLNRRRTRFLATLDLLNDANAKLTTEDQFETTSFALDFVQGQYRNDKMFSISNRELIIDFIRYLTQRIRDKVNTIEEEIIEA